MKAPSAEPRRLATYLRALTARYPELVDDDEANDALWASGPLIENVSGPIAYIGLKLGSLVYDGWRCCVETAHSQGLVGFDPQLDALANPDPTASPAVLWPRHRGGAVYLALAGVARPGSPVLIRLAPMTALRRRWWWRWTKYPRSYDGGSYRIESRWKEEVVYWEGPRGVVFGAGWGVKPPVVYVPSAAVWDQVVPPWLRGRRDQVIARMRDHSGHVVETERGYEPGSDTLGELAPVASAEEAQGIAARFLKRASPIAEYFIADAEPREDARGWMFRCEPSAATSREPDGAMAQPFTLLVRRDTGEPDIESDRGSDAT